MPCIDRLAQLMSPLKTGIGNSEIAVLHAYTAQEDMKRKREEDEVRRKD